MTSDDLFGPLLVPDELRGAISGRAWLQALLDAERALASAEARAGAIPAAAAEAIARACDADRFDTEAIARDGRRAGNPSEPLVRALREQVGGDAADYVHWGATSQDVLDTAAMLVVQRARALVVADLDGVARACARLADEHRATVLAARTLLQQAVPTTFGLKAATWLVGVLEARGRLTAIELEAQLGGAGGTLAALGERGPDVLRLFAEEIGLAEPTLPWHTVRVRVADLGAALALVAGACAKIALDVILLAQTEVGEATSGDGASSTMPHKRNPSAAVLAVASARAVASQTGVLVGALVQEHERAAGAWHAEWTALSQALGAGGAAASWTRTTLERLEVDAARMRANVAGAALSERALFLLAERIGRSEAQSLLGGSRPVRDVLAEHLQPDEVEAALDPAGYLGAADAFVERALVRYRRELG